ncbi:MAG: hypothetical protein ACOCQQ_01220 [Candidatus Nanoarchaeia archaeon]
MKRRTFWLTTSLVSLILCSSLFSHSQKTTSNEFFSPDSITLSAKKDFISKDSFIHSSDSLHSSTCLDYSDVLDSLQSKECVDKQTQLSTADSLNVSNSRFKLGAIFSNTPFLGVAGSFDVIRSKTKKGKPFSVGIDGLFNIIALTPVSKTYESLPQESSLGSQYHTKNLYILEGKLYNPGHLGVNFSRGSLYAGIGLSYQGVKSYTYSCIQSTYDSSTGNIAFPSKLLFENKIDGVHSFPLYARLGIQRNRYGSKVDFFFGYATDKFTKPSSQTNASHQFFIGFQKQL